MIADALPWLNLLLIPMLVHTLHTDRRITRLEAQMSILLQRVGIER